MANQDWFNDTDKVALLIVTSSIVVISILLVATSHAPSSLFAQQQDSGFLTYENLDYNVSIDYPVNWTKSEINLNPYNVAFFYPTKINRSIFELSEPVTLSISVRQLLNQSSLNQAEAKIDSFFSGNLQYRLVNKTIANTTLSGIPAYEIIYYSYTNNETRKWLEVGSTLDNESYVLTYQAEPGYFDQYLPVGERMIDSFQITDENSRSSSTNINKTKD